MPFCGAIGEKTEALLWMSGAVCSVVVLVCCDLPLVLWSFGAVNIAGQDTFDSLAESVFLVRFLLLRLGSFDVLFGLVVCVFLIRDAGVGWAGSNGIRTLSTLEKFEFTDKNIPTSSTSAFLKIRFFPPSTFLFKSLACFAILSSLIFPNGVLGPLSA